MNQAQFLQALQKHLEGLSPEEGADILQDFTEHFTIGLTEGKTEEEIAASLGSPSHIAREMLASYHLNNATKKTTTGNVFRAVWAAIGLSFFNLVIVLGPFIALVGIVFAGWVSGVSFIASPFLVTFKYVIVPESFTYFELFLSIGLAGLGIFLCIGMYYATKYFYIYFIKYLKFNAKVIKGA